jgi:hypothetical protein
VRIIPFYTKRNYSHKSRFLLPKMFIFLSQTEFKPGTTLRRVFLYEDEDYENAIMTDKVMYEDEVEIEDDDDVECYGPEDG